MLIQYIYIYIYWLVRLTTYKGVTRAYIPICVYILKFFYLFLFWIYFQGVIYAFIGLIIPLIIIYYCTFRNTYTYIYTWAGTDGLKSFYIWLCNVFEFICSILRTSLLLIFAIVHVIFWLRVKHILRVFL